MGLKGRESLNLKKKGGAGQVINSWLLRHSQTIFQKASHHERAIEAVEFSNVPTSPKLLALTEAPLPKHRKRRYGAHHFLLEIFALTRAFFGGSAGL